MDDDAIASIIIFSSLFSNKDAKETVLVQPYEDYVTQFNDAAIALFAIAPTIKNVDKLPDEDAQLTFVTQFRELLRLKNVLTTFADYKETDLTLEPQKIDS